MDNLEELADGGRPYVKSSSIAARNMLAMFGDLFCVTRLRSRPRSRSPAAKRGVQLIEPFAGQLGESFEGPVKRLQSAVDLIEPVGPEIDRPPIMAGKEVTRRRVSGG